MDHTKIDPADLDSPHQDLSVRGLRFVVALSVFSGIDLSCVSAYSRVLIQLYMDRGRYFVRCNTLRKIAMIFAKRSNMEGNCNKDY